MFDLKGLRVWKIGCKHIRGNIVRKLRYVVIKEEKHWDSPKTIAQVYLDRGKNIPDVAIVKKNAPDKIIDQVAQ